jgi:hypothetical protein
VAATDARRRAEQVLLGTLRIGLHEQTRLQPEIAEALDAPIADPAEVKARLLARLRRDAPGPNRRLETDAGLLDAVTRHLVEAVRRRVRRTLTEHLMTLELPGGRLRLGEDIAGTCPPHLRQPVDPELGALLTTVRLGPAGAAGSGAVDWADLDDRMQYIGELFRTRQEDTALLSAPFDPEQVVAIRAGRLPDGRL